MGELDDLLQAIKEYKLKYEITENSSEADKLRHRITKGRKTNEEWIQIREDVRRFVKSDASEDDKKMLRGYTESLCMICSAIDEGLM